MSLDRIAGRIVFTCDACPDALETDTRNFNEAREALRDAGWRTIPNGSEWEHFCPACKSRST